MRNCIFTNNYAGKGGAVYNMASTQMGGLPGDPLPVFVNVTFVENTASARGGAVENDLSTHAIFSNCSFLKNSCDAKGGALYNDFGCSPILTNCIFAGNYAVKAAAAGNDGSSDPVFINCIFYDNEAWDQGAAIYNGSHGASSPANYPTLINCIIWSNKVTTIGPADFSNWHDNEPTVSHSLIESGHSGTGNITDNPLFVDGPAYDFRLLAGSPCIDTGTNLPGLSTATDLDGLDRIYNGTVDIGPYEFIPEPCHLLFIICQLFFINYFRRN